VFSKLNFFRFSGVGMFFWNRDVKGGGQAHVFVCTARGGGFHWGPALEREKVGAGGKGTGLRHGPAPLLSGGDVFFLFLANGAFIGGLGLCCVGGPIDFLGGGFLFIWGGDPLEVGGPQERPRRLPALWLCVFCAGFSGLFCDFLGTLIGGEVWQSRGGRGKNFIGGGGGGGGGGNF